MKSPRRSTIPPTVIKYDRDSPEAKDKKESRDTSVSVDTEVSTDTIFSSLVKSIKESSETPGRPKLNVKILELSSTSITIVIDGADQTTVNAFQRVIMQEVSTMGIKFIIVHTNTSSLSDEVLAGRIGLIPLTSTHVDEFEEDSYCTCEKACGKCAVEMKLHVLSKKDGLKITSRDIKSSDSRVVPITNPIYKNPDYDPGIPLLRLDKNQEINITIIATKGVGKTHSKWNPSSKISIQPIPVIKINNKIFDELEPESQRDWLDSCPSGVFKHDPDKGIEIEDAMKCSTCNMCVSKSEDLGVPGMVTVDTRPYTHVVRIETRGGMKPSHIVKKAMQILLEKLQSVRKQFNL